MYNTFIHPNQSTEMAGDNCTGSFKTKKTSVLLFSHQVEDNGWSFEYFITHYKHTTPMYNALKNTHRMHKNVHTQYTHNTPAIHTAHIEGRGIEFSFNFPQIYTLLFHTLLCLISITQS